MAVSLITGGTTGATGFTLPCGATSNRIAIVAEEISGATPAVPTVGGVNTVDAGSLSTFGGTLHTRICYLVAPASGDQTVSFGGIAAWAMVLDGVDQTTPKDTTGNVDTAASGSMNVALTVTATGCWAIGTSDNTTGSETATGVLTVKYFDQLMTSGGTVGTGSQTGGATFGGGGNGGMVMTAFKPVQATARNLLTLGVGA